MLISLNIDGKEVTGYKGQTILEVARANEIVIPTLCFDELVKPYGGCGLCVVEVKGSKKLVRACATEISAGMVLFTDSERVRESRKLTLELLLSDHTGDCRGPCINECPAHTDVQGYVGLIANGKYHAALELIKEKVPLPASIGRVCPHPCETGCRRQLVEAPIAIAALKSFVADLDLHSGQPYLPVIKPTTNKKIAVVGAGPAGLTVAYYTALEGHAVTVYDAMPEGGGMLRYGIPGYRLPKAVLNQEIGLIESLGVELNYNTRIGTDITLDYLRRQYDAVFLGIGAWESTGMRCEGEELPGVIGGIDFLRKVSMHEKVHIGERVAVVGGGNTAMDAARTAVRLGAKQVVILYRRTREEMPAEDIEIAEAMEEGVEFRFLVAPLAVNPETGQAYTVTLQKMRLGEPDASGRRSPVPIPGETEIISVDTVISAIGQKVNAAGIAGISLTKWGTIAVDEKTLQTNLPGVFAGGDGVTGPKIAIDAIAQGRQAADAILCYLSGAELVKGSQYLAVNHDLTSADFTDYAKKERLQVPVLSPAERRTNFREVGLGVTELAAATEANRCLECGCKDYFNCKLINNANAYAAEPDRLAGARKQSKVKDEHPFIERNPAKCILCGLCMRVCSEVMGITALGLVQRGFDSEMQPEFNLPLCATDCNGCGQCVAACPTGALVERYPLKKNLPLRTTEITTTCSFCGVGCGQVIHKAGELVLKAMPLPGEVLCQQGRFGIDAFTKDRLTQPLVRKGTDLVEATWPEAYQRIAEAVQRIKSRDGGNALALAIAPHYTMEEGNIAVQFGRRVLESENVFSFTPNPAAALTPIFGAPGSTNRFDELQGTDLILMIGSCNTSQVAAVKIRQAVQRGAKLILINEEASLVDDVAAMKITPDNNLQLLKEILAAVINQGLTSQHFINKWVNGYPELAAALAEIKSSEFALRCGEIYAKAVNAMIVIDGNCVTGAGIQLLATLALLTGKVGSPRNGLIVVTPGCNTNGISSLGVDAKGNYCFTALQADGLKGMFIFGEDPVGSGMLTPNEFRTMELTVVLTPSMTLTAANADIVLPAATPIETAGTYLSADWQASRFPRVTTPLTGRDNCEIIVGLAAVMHMELDHNEQFGNYGDKMSYVDGFLWPDRKARLLIPEDTLLFDYGFKQK